MWIRVQECHECGALAYRRTDVGPKLLMESPVWRAYVAGGCQGVAPAVCQVAWVRVDAELGASAWPRVIGAAPELALLEVLSSSDGELQAPPVCPACRAGAVEHA